MELLDNTYIKARKSWNIVMNGWLQCDETQNGQKECDNFWLK
jgi:hypothetical protein